MKAGLSAIQQFCSSHPNDFCWWQADSTVDVHALRESTTHVLEPGIDIEPFLQVPGKSLVLIDAMCWLSHPLVQNLQQLLTPEMEASADHPLGELRRLSLALSSPVLSEMTCLSWTAASTLFAIFGPVGEFSPGSIQTITQCHLGTNSSTQIHVIQFAWKGAVATVEISTGLPARNWIEGVGSNGSLVADGFLSPSQAQKPRYWLHDLAGNVCGVDFPQGDEIADFLREISSGMARQEFRNRWNTRIRGTYAWSQILKKTVSESTMSPNLRQ